MYDSTASTLRDGHRSAADTSRAGLSTWHRVYLSLGSNVEPERHLQAALLRLRERFRLVQVSNTWRTAPIHCADQPCYLNLAAAMDTRAEPEELYRQLKLLEQDVGRCKHSRSEPCEIDVDILFYDDLVADFGRLRLPHRSIPHCAYVLAPLAELAPDLVHPTEGRTIAQLLARIDPAQRQGVEDIGPLPREAVDDALR